MYLIVVTDTDLAAIVVVIIVVVVSAVVGAVISANENNFRVDSVVKTMDLWYTYDLFLTEYRPKHHMLPGNINWSS